MRIINPHWPSLRETRETLLAPLAGLVLRRQVSRIDSVEGLIDLMFGFSRFGLPICPLQRPAEIVELLNIVARDPPARVLEIGTANGGTLFGLAQVSRADAQLISVDLPGGRFGGGYARSRIGLYRQFRRGKQRIHLLRSDSHNPSTAQQVKQLLAGEPLDFLFIDGDHSYEGVRQDFDLYGSLVRAGGLIALHDIAPPGPVTPETRECDGGDVPRFWHEVAANFRCREIIDPAGGGWFGIGLVFL